MLEQKIIDLLSRGELVPLSEKALRKRLRIRSDQEKDLNEALGILQDHGIIAEIKGELFALSGDADLVSGRLRMNRKGGGVVFPEMISESPIQIESGMAGTAFHEDRVLVRIQPEGAGGRSTPNSSSTARIGKVIRILERARTHIVGTLWKSRNIYYVVPDHFRFPHDIYVTFSKKLRVKPRKGAKVVVRLEEWETHRHNPEGVVEEVLGIGKSFEIETEAILKQFDLKSTFPARVVSESRRLNPPQESLLLKNRMDCRKDDIVTIDPKDAKDFDDAVFLRKLPDGGWKLWVHIADVSYYVRPGTALDKEARKRANSTYLIDRVIPMLPERLSNDLCSLRPNEDRLTKCVEFDLDRHGKVRRFEFYSAVIHSKQRFTYEEVQTVLARPAKGEVEIMLHQAQSLAAKLRSLRMGNGSLDLSMAEYRFELDSHNRLCGVVRREPDASHQLIEEFMLLANEAAAKKMADRKGKALYRIHQAPDEERLIQFGKSLKAHDIRVGNLTRPKEVQSLLNQLGKHPIGQVLQIGLLRCLKQARYYPERVMHYGLAKEYYTHFTSPIRRYSDLVVHRILFEGDRDSGRDLFALSDHLSTSERSSAEAEQAHKFLILYDYLEAQLLLPVDEQKTFEASVTEIRNFGMFIELAEYGVSGLLPVSSLKDDFYVYQADRNQLVGRRRRKVFRLGDSLEVRILKVDRFKKQVDFTLVTSSAKKSGKKKDPSERREKKAKIGEKATIKAREKPAEKKGKMRVRKFYKKKHAKFPREKKEVKPT